jgi:hypothetical protein
MAYARTTAWFWKWLGFPDHSQDLRVRYPIVGFFSWFFTSHTQLTLMTPVLNKGMLGLSKREYFLVDIGIVACLVWFGPTGHFMFNSGLNWENACMLYVFAGFFGVHGWSFGTVRTWFLFLFQFLALRYCTVGDIFRIIPTSWRWVFVTFRFGIMPWEQRVCRVARPWAAYLCPGNYVAGAIAIYAFRTLSFPAGISRTICFVANKAFTLHLIECVLIIFGKKAWDMLRYWERVRPPTMAIVNLWLSTVQFLFLGVFFEIYRERIFVFVLKLLSSACEWFVLLLRSSAFVLKCKNVTKMNPVTQINEENP